MLGAGGMVESVKICCDLKVGKEVSVLVGRDFLTYGSEAGT